MAEVDARAAAAATGADEARGGAAEGGQQPAVKGAATISVTVVLLAVLVASVAVLLTSVPRAGVGVGKGMEGAGGGAGEVGKQRAEPVEHAVGGDARIPGFNSRLDAFRAWARLTWMKLRRPRSDEPRYGGDATGSAGSVADAAKKSFETGKETVEQAAAAAAARATGDAVEATKEKVKGAASPSPSSDG